ncbi:hypothetical protein GJAV_G00179540 [Gymnothorax javanicus]|nr:hypothetical protein GJAV_G00179540 [Gymnothorax javanicus]
MNPTLSNSTLACSQPSTVNRDFADSHFRPRVCHARFQHQLKVEVWREGPVRWTRKAAVGIPDSQSSGKFVALRSTVEEAHEFGEEQDARDIKSGLTSGRVDRSNRRALPSIVILNSDLRKEKRQRALHRKQDRMMSTPYRKSADVVELVSSLGWADEDLSSQDSEGAPEVGRFGMDRHGREPGSEDMEEEEEEEGEEDCGEGGPKRRGPKKKKMTKARLERFRARRVKANARERSRMHGLNDALENLRSVMPCFSKTQKLSKIETLRLARNYIWALSEALEGGLSTDSRGFLEALCKGLSQPTSNLVAGCLQLSSTHDLLGSTPNLLSPTPTVIDRSEGKSKVPLLSYHSSGLPSPPYGSVETPHLPHVNNYRSGYETPSPAEGSTGTPPYNGPLSPPLSVSGAFALKQETSPCETDRSCNTIHPAATYTSSPNPYHPHGPPVYHQSRYDLPLGVPFESLFGSAHGVSAQMGTIYGE